MINKDNRVQISTEKKLQASIDSAQPSVYFRGVNRVHINRFKAYTHIISNQLNANWLITDDIKSANVVVDWVQPADQHVKSLQMSVLAGTANLKPTVLSAFKLLFDDKKLVQQLNQASARLKQANHSTKGINKSEHVIKVCGLLNESLSLLCDLLNQKSPITRFVPSLGVISSHNELYQDQLLLIVDGQIETSVFAYKTLIAKKNSANIIIDKLTVAIIKSNDDTVNEKIFDMVYGDADDHTQVTLLNVEDEKELDFFVSYL